MAEIEGLVRALRWGDDAAKVAAARTLRELACNRPANTVLIAKAGGIPPLVQLVHDGSAEARWTAAWALGYLACYNAANKVLIAEAGGIASLVELLRDGSTYAKWSPAYALGNIAHNNDANAVAIAVAAGFDALVQLARCGRVTVDNRSVVDDAGFAAKRKAALVVAALLRACVPDELRSRVDVQDVIRGVIGPYL
ncbi:ubiquitin-protein transferase [Aureococcus anophagefferens]|nr:ubiquitin-protein transferase [Aureococcus anophagefferens]